MSYNLEFDANVKKAQFIDGAVKIQESFGFAQPNEILEAIQTYAGHWYGSGIWEESGQLNKSGSTTVKVTWDVPRSPHTFLVDNLLHRTCL